MNRIIVVGGGISGLAFAYEALLRKFDVMVIESTSTIGGISRTIAHNGCHLDIGVHVMYLKDKDVYNKIEEIVDRDKWIKIRRKGKLYLKGRYIDWPLKFSSVRQLPLTFGVKVLWDQIAKKKAGNETASNYRSELLNLYGPALYNSFFHPLTMKFLKADPQKIHSDWAFSSIRSATKIEDKSFLESYKYVPDTMDAESKKSFNVVNFLLHSLGKDLDDEPFYYFMNGFGTLCEAYKDKILKLGGKVLTNSTVNSLMVEKDKVIRCAINGKAYDADYIVWTVNPFDLCNMLGVECPPLQYLHTKFIYFFLRDCNKDHQVCYYADPDIGFVRGTILSNISRTVINNKDISDLVCLEYTFRSKEDMLEDTSVVDIAKREIKKVKIINDDSSIESVFEVNAPYTYPVLTTDYRDMVKGLQNRLGRFKNIITFGRQANFNYDNLDVVIKEVVNHPFFKMRGDAHVKDIDNKIGVLRNA